MKQKPYLYDEQLKKVSCYSYVDFIKTIVEFQTKNEIDYNKTIAAPAYCFIHKDGTSENFYNWYNLFPVIEEKYGIEIVVNQSQVNLQCYHLFLKPSAPEPVLEKPPVEPLEVIEDIVTEVPVIEVEVQEEDSLSVDWDKVWAMQDDNEKAASKEALCQYALTFGVELRKNKKFEKMVDEFKDALAK